jgi:hypothetical protein
LLSDLGIRPIYHYTEPEPDQAALLEKLQLAMPGQPPPRIRSGKLLLPEEQGKEAVVKTS